MVARKQFEICGIFKPVGFTDCGLICESCFQKECQINAFNQGVERAAVVCDGMAERLSPKDCATAIRSVKMLEHKKEPTPDVINMNEVK